MKRLKIWLNGFTLMQQYFVVSLLAVLVFLLFIFQFLTINVDNFTNQQMFSYLHRSQNNYLNAYNASLDYVDNNCFHYTINKKDLISCGDLPCLILKQNGFEPQFEDTKDGVFMYDSETIVYSVKDNGNSYLVSIINNEYRNEFKSSLVSGILNSVIIVIVIIFMILMMWVYSLIHPLNQIRNYIKKIKNDEKATLLIKRNDEIGEVAEAVVDMNEELSAQGKIREEMIQNISHDLKTPIATIKSYCESIKDGIYPYDTLEKSVDVILEHADRLEKKVYSLITYNKIGYLEDNDSGDTVPMKDVIEKAILSCKVLRNDINIDTSEVENDVYFHGEKEAWRTAVENLLDNALRYAESEVKISLSKNLFEIFDDGQLLSKDRIDKLFKPYEKGNKGNFGLGLSIVKRVCDTYGYVVIGENKTNGVVFRIYRNMSKAKQKSKKS